MPRSAATGETIEMAVGPIEMAVGTQAYTEFFHVDADEDTKNDNIVGGAGSALKEDRHVVSGYVEFSVPLALKHRVGFSGTSGLSTPILVKRLARRPLFVGKSLLM